MTQGVCLCGRVQYEFTAPFQMMLHCHCSMCRKHHGAAFATFVSAPLAAFRWIAGEKEIGRYQSSAQGGRAYCTHCGSIAPVLMPEAGFAIAPAGNLEGDPGIRPRGHMFVGSKAPWYESTAARRGSARARRGDGRRQAGAEATWRRRWRQLSLRRGRVRAAKSHPDLQLSLLALSPRTQRGARIESIRQPRRLHARTRV